MNKAQRKAQARRRAKVIAKAKRQGVKPGSGLQIDRDGRITFAPKGGSTGTRYGGWAGADHSGRGRVRHQSGGR
jgi:hypothetical protein